MANAKRISIKTDIRRTGRNTVTVRTTTKNGNTTKTTTKTIHIH